MPSPRQSLGRPSKDLHIVVGVLLLQQLHDMTDAQTVEALAFNMAWHYALDVRSDADSYFCEKTLRNYPRLFIEQDFDEVLFRHLTDRLVRAFAVDTSRQRLDSTALRPTMRTLTRLGIVAQTISKFVREIERHHPDLYGQICSRSFAVMLIAKGMAPLRIQRQVFRSDGLARLGRISCRLRSNFVTRRPLNSEVSCAADSGPRQLSRTTAMR
jgi:hypothetical protein